MDWMTLSVELIGIAILAVWIVLPIREFGSIARRVWGAKNRNLDETSAAETTPVLAETR